MPNAVTRKRRVAKGLCPECGINPLGTVRQTCDDCHAGTSPRPPRTWKVTPEILAAKRKKDTARVRSRRLREKRLAAGLCPLCGVNKRGDKGQRCADCRNVNRLSAARIRRISTKHGWCAWFGCLEQTQGTWYCDKHRGRQAATKRKREAVARIKKVHTSRRATYDHRPAEGAPAGPAAGG